MALGKSAGRRVGRAPASAQPSTEERGTRRTSISDKRGTVDPVEHDEYIGEPLRFDPDEPPAHVRVGVGRTINMGDFNTLRIDVSVSLPSRSDDDSLDDTYERASEFAASKLDEEHSRWLNPPQKTRAHQPAAPRPNMRKTRQ